LRYAYEDLSEDQYEHLVVVVCTFLFGPSVQPFAKGKDGGRDARFDGSAERHPSSASPWVGKSVIQAKHTNGINMHFSDADFFSTTAAKSVVTDEIENIKVLKAANELEHYMLFSNRKLTAGAEAAIRKHLSEQCQMEKSSIFLVGNEQMEIYIKLYPQVSTIANLSSIDAPLIVNVDDLSSVIEALVEQKGSFKDVADDPPTPRLAYEKKNEINQMSPEYATLIRKNYLSETPQIRTFLSLPENSDLLKKYEDVVDEFQAKIIAHRKDYQSFDLVMNYLLDLLFKRDPVLSANRRLTRIMLFYMYWNCDIGSTTEIGSAPDATAN
jgi:hypothetical protein